MKRKFTVALVSGSAGGVSNFTEANLRVRAEPAMKLDDVENLLTAAPDMRDALVLLSEWVEGNVAYGMPENIARAVGAALQKAKGE